MFLAIDIGGTKTIAACFDAGGNLQDKIKFPTPKDYAEFISAVEENVAKLSTKNFIAAGVAVPGLLSREKGIVYALGNLPWANQKIRDDISAKVNNIPVVIENDARLAGLSEALLLKDKYRDVLYMTVSTGIGGAFVEQGKIVKPLQDMEMGKMPLMFEGNLVHWEDFAGGRGIVERFGKKASEITDPKDWEQIGQNVAYGLAVACSIMQPEVVIMDGGVGQFSDKFSPTVKDYLQKNLHAVVRHPEIITATRKNEAVLHGCYEIANQYYGKSA